VKCPNYPCFLVTICSTHGKLCSFGKKRGRRGAHGDVRGDRRVGASREHRYGVAQDADRALRLHCFLLLGGEQSTSQKTLLLDTIVLCANVFSRMCIARVSLRSLELYTPCITSQRDVISDGVEHK
jgi:hypothetical protein